MKTIERGRAMSSDPRKAALFILNTLDTGRDTLDQVMEDLFREIPDMSKRDKALLYSLVYGVLRRKARLDWILSAFSKTPIPKIDPPVLNLLRLSLFQIIFMERIPVSAAVNTAVEIAKTFSSPWVVKFVNGVLRNASREHQGVIFPRLDDDPAKALAITESFPSWLVQKWLKRFGVEEAGRLLKALNEIPPITLRTNTLRTDRDSLCVHLQTHCKTVKATETVPEGISITTPDTPLSEMAAFKTGLFSVQDEGAQAVSHFLDPKPGESVLDACAGLGGKTGHLAQIMGDSGHIVAADKNARKLSRLMIEMQRLGLTSIIPVEQDWMFGSSGENHGFFDKILVDSPCSGLGVIRRNPDTKWRIEPGLLHPMQTKQYEILHKLVHNLKPGGVIVYTVCSMEPEENEEVVQMFLQNHKNFIMEKPDTSRPAWMKKLVDPDGCLRTYPQDHGMDGFFAVRLKKQKENVKP